LVPARTKTATQAPRGHAARAVREALLVRRLGEFPSEQPNTIGPVEDYTGAWTLSGATLDPVYALTNRSALSGRRVRSLRLSALLVYAGS
jgi:hypothetical protein